MDTKRYKFLHISDLHIDGYFNDRKSIWIKKLLSCQGLPEIREAVLKMIQEQFSPEIEGIIISGDLTCFGDDRDLRKAVEFINLIRKHNKVILIPGNHDRYCGGVAGRPNSILFENYFYKDWRINQRIKPRLIKLSGGQKIVFVCADFSLQDFNGISDFFSKYGCGQVTDPDIVKITSITKKLNKINIPTVWMVHFAPTSRTAMRVKNNLKLRGEDKLINAAESCNVNHIFVGHTHLKGFYLSDYSKNVKIHCAGTAGLIKSSEDTSIHLREILIKDNTIVNIINTDYEWHNNQFLKI